MYCILLLFLFLFLFVLLSGGGHVLKSHQGATVTNPLSHRSLDVIDRESCTSCHESSDRLEIVLGGIQERFVDLW